jgi:hypothetical protein
VCAGQKFVGKVEYIDAGWRQLILGLGAAGERGARQQPRPRIWLGNLELPSLNINVKLRNSPTCNPELRTMETPSGC